MSKQEEQQIEIGWRKELLEKEVEEKESSPKLNKATKYHKLSSEDSESSSNSGSSGSSSDSSGDDRKKKKKGKYEKKEKYRQEKKVKKEKRKLEKAQRREIKKAKKEKRKEEKKLKKLAKKMKNADQEDGDCAIPIDLMYAKAQAPETRKEYEARQSQIRRVVDPITGRTRLIKGDGEILEEIVNREQHKEINKRATQGDGDFFQSKTIGWKFS